MSRRSSTVISALAPDLVILQEATKPDVVERVAARNRHGAVGITARRVARLHEPPPVAHAEWHKPRFSRHAYLEVVPEGCEWRAFGVHLSAVHAAWTERRRVYELRTLLAAIARQQPGPHALVGDFNTLAPGSSSTSGSCRTGCAPWSG